MKYLVTLCLIVVAITGTAQSFETDSLMDGTKFVKGEFLIKLKPQVKSSLKGIQVEKQIRQTREKYKLSTKREWGTGVQLWQTTNKTVHPNLDSK